MVNELAADFFEADFQKWINQKKKMVTMLKNSLNIKFFNDVIIFSNEKFLTSQKIIETLFLKQPLYIFFMDDRIIRLRLTN